MHGLLVLDEGLQDQVKQTGLKVFANTTGDNMAPGFVEGLLAVYTKNKEIVESAFSNDKQFCSALDISFAAVVNHRPSLSQPCKSAELLAKCCDILLKKSADGPDEAQIDVKLDGCFKILAYLNEKEEFEMFYSAFLAKRLIQENSRSMDAEETMTNRFKDVSGRKFTDELQRTITDISVSADLNKEFNNIFQKDQHEPGIDFSVRVLQSRALPLEHSSQAVDFTVPQELENRAKSFEDFYSNHYHKHRKLAWLDPMSTVEMKVNCFQKSYDITMQIPPMKLLLMFEKTNSMTCQELETATQLDPAHFQASLQILVDSQLVTVSCNPSEIFEPLAIISLNLAFSHEQSKFKLPFVDMKDPIQEAEQIRCAVKENRINFLQVGIFVF